MSRTTIVPTVQTKANQATDFYLTAEGENEVVQKSYVATGQAAPFEPGLFTSRTEPGNNAVRIEDFTTGNARWGIGLVNAETGVGNAGSDLAFYAYSDANALLGSRMTIDRSDGSVIIPAAAAVGTVLNVGLQAATGDINVVGPSGAGQVFDAIYNRPGPVDYVFSLDGITLAGLTNPITSGQNQTGTTFTPLITGMYLIEGTIGASGSVWTAAFGDKLQVVLEPVPAVPGVLPASCGVIMMSNGTGFSSWTSMSCDKLVAGVSYTVAVTFENNSGTMANNNDEIILEINITQLC